MDEIGFENTEKIKVMASEANRWRFIYDVAKSYGFEGIHLTPSLYSKDFGLDLENIPEYFQGFKLTLHFGGLHKITSEVAYEEFDKSLSKYFDIALRNNMHDISLHPPDIYGITAEEKEVCRSLLRRAIEKWLPIATQNGTSLSLETHVSGKYFLFDGLQEYVDFVSDYPTLGVLIDISHNFYDGFSEDEIIRLLADKNVKGLHISDALQKAKGASFETGTHAAVGDGAVDFGKILTAFKYIPGLYAALEIKASNECVARSLTNLKQMLM